MTRAEIIDAYVAGGSLKAVAMVAECHHETVRKYVKAAGIPMRDRRYRMPPPVTVHVGIRYPKLTPEQVRSIRSRYAGENRPSMRQLACEFSVTPGAILKIIHREVHRLI